MSYIFQHKLDADDHGTMTGWEILSDDEFNEMKESLKRYKPAFDDGFEYISYEWDYDSTWEYKDFEKLLKSGNHIDEEYAGVIRSLVPDLEWNRLTAFFDEIENQLADWEDDKGDEEDENEQEKEPVIEGTWICVNCTQDKIPNHLNICPNCGYEYR